MIDIKRPMLIFSWDSNYHKLKVLGLFSRTLNLDISLHVGFSKRFPHCINLVVKLMIIIDKLYLSWWYYYLL